MYVPVGQRGTSGSRGMSPQQSAAMGGQGIAAGIRAAEASMMAKKREARRIYERAENMMREDLNTVAGFDISKAGPDAAKALTEEANLLKQKIREANDPIEAQALISDFRQKYNFFSNREQQLQEERKFADTLSVASRDQRDALNAGLEVGMEYEDIDSSSVARMDQQFRQNIIRDEETGQIMVQRADGELVPYDQAQELLDFSVYLPKTRKTDIGDLQTSAMNEALQNRIIARGGGVFTEEAARKEYNTLTENSNRNGQALRLQILEDYVDTAMRERGRIVQGAESDEAREAKRLEFFANEDQLKAWQLGPGARDRFQGEESDWNEVWGEDGNGWQLVDSEREKFIEYARTAKSIDQRLKEERLKLSKREQEEASNYIFDGLVESVETAEGPQPETAQSYGMTALKEPVKVEASTMADGGDYEIHGFGVDPRTGFPTARIFDVVEAEVFKYLDDDNKIKYADSLDEAQRKGQVMNEGKPISFEDKTPRTIVIGPGNEDLGNEVYNRIFGVDPISGKPTNLEAVELLLAHKNKANRAAWEAATGQ